MANQKQFLIATIDNPYASRGESGFLRSTIDLGYASTPIEGTDGKTYDGEKFEIFWPVPQGDSLEALEADCKTLFGDECSVNEMIKAAVRQFSTRPNYKAGAEGKDKEAAHANAQDMAMNYNIGRQAPTGTSQKSKAKKLDSVQADAKALGFDSIEDMIQAYKEGRL